MQLTNNGSGTRDSRCKGTEGRRKLGMTTRGGKKRAYRMASSGQGAWTLSKARETLEG